jgi:hypothetical protein
MSIHACTLGLDTHGSVNLAMLPAEEMSVGETSKAMHQHASACFSPQAMGEGSWDESEREVDNSSSCIEDGENNSTASHVADSEINNESTRRLPFQPWLRRPLDDARTNSNSSPARKNSPRLGGTDGNLLSGKPCFSENLYYFLILIKNLRKSALNFTHAHTHNTHDAQVLRISRGSTFRPQRGTSTVSAMLCRTPKRET